MNECSSKPTKSNEIQDKFQSEYNDDDYQYFDSNGNSLVFYISKHNVYIKRIAEGFDESKINYLLELNLDHENIQKNFLCFAQNYNNKNVYWFITEQNNIYNNALVYFRKPDVKKLCRDVCRGLVYLHERNIINNNINRFSIFGIRRLNNNSNIKLQELIQDIVTQLQGHNFSENLNSFEVLMNYYSNKKCTDLKVKLNPQKILLVPEKLYDLKVSMRANPFYPESKSEIFVYIASNSEWCCKRFKADDIYVTSLITYEQEILEIFKYFMNGITCTSEHYAEYEVGPVYILQENNRGYKRFMDFYFDKHGLTFQTTFKEQTLKDILLEGEIDFKISNIENCYSVQKKYIIDKKYNRGYTPPEYIENEIICCKSDIWRLGILALNLISPGFNEYLKRYDITDEKVLKELKSYQLKNLRHYLDEDISDFIKKCLNFNPDLRPTALELLRHPYINDVTVAK